ncbi:hypothetical protein [Methanobacterium formicicum]|uniref:Apea-like HEPN domain-containing protein n=1 Tax=Methanobacterium formicicum (strain DSM 3637 / PP1) TaxID=1204725 RepID=K2QEN3_METFP|nr:hypothetical protein [Methanobacterium formicicum]EKF86551.1 hypothetical protein A994_03673 [Methanobacterium formicicum DSM 3637]
MKNQSYIESKYLLGCVLLETLKYAYADHFKSYEKKKDFFYREGTTERYTFKDLIYEIFSEFDININKLQSWIDQVEDGFYHIRSDLNRYCIKELGIKGYNFDNQLFNELCSSHNIQFNESFIEYLTKYRNEVIHTGKIGTTYPHLKLHLNYLEISIELLLMNILGVNCLYWNSPDDCWSNSLDLLNRLK